MSRTPAKISSFPVLNIGGFYRESQKGFQWLADHQNLDGSWFSSYVDGKPEDKTCETHIACYIGVGLFHTYLITQDISLLERHWATMEKGVEFALSLQTATGEIYWAKSPEGQTDPMSLLAGSSSIFMSLKCALAIAALLGKEKKYWELGFIPSCAGPSREKRPRPDWTGIGASISLKDREQDACLTSPGLPLPRHRNWFLP
jgi:hypothetical protein